MAFLSTRFPDGISFGAEGGPGYQTDVVRTDGGHESRNQSWDTALRTYDVAHAARLPEVWGQLLAFFHMARGRTHAFRFKDWADYQCPDDAGDGIFEQITPTTFQLIKRYGGSPYAMDRTITRPVSGTLVITITGGTVASIDYTTGIVTMSAGTPSSWTGQFDVPCRFDIDELPQSILNKAGNEFIVGTQAIRIVEVRE